MIPTTKQCKGYPEGTCQETITDNSTNQKKLYCEKCRIKRGAALDTQTSKKRKIRKI